MAESPVFRTMLTSNFMEKDARLIEIPDKDPTTFALFLRHTLPGFNGLILSDASLLKVDNVLAACTSENEYKSVDKLIDHILEAELYTLSKYLTASIQKASEFSPTAFERNRIFHRISSDTKANIFTMRCKAMESDITNCMHVLERYGYADLCKNVECGAKKGYRGKNCIQ
ncbi:unnamed protein product [Mytilus edulis]|uniref:BTB domain-containing protein n=1 Tax=Mytilus edulis TaxID=6550 RepID=A0A8S3PP65_MYTED|nr:unnamed protein product [Mytilus edulis]